MDCPIPCQPEQPLEIWAGIECTVNRVQDAYFDQLQRNGHTGRANDLERFAGLGIQAIRYPVLWEKIAPRGLHCAAWSWPDRQLHRLKELNLRPIVGLVHHGSGPRGTSLVDPQFPERLASYAAVVAERYPWVEDYTPVNEPLTTARFSGLYGHWYPHGHDNLTCARALLNQCRGVVLAMRAIRKFNPAARLVQTEDLSKTHGTRALTYQADFENERRWLSLDLLTGRLSPEKPLWGFLRYVGIAEDDLRWFQENNCPPDVIGANYYVTSERFLDERVERYPAWTHGGNGRHAYADVEAVRGRRLGLDGLAVLLGELWARYRLPLAVTEAHIGCHRETQLRWLLECWNAARQARAQGVDLRALTAWSLLGSFDWNCLLTEVRNYYESGVFDLRSPEPRPTALAGMLKQMTAGQTPDHPALASPGWWRLPERLTFRGQKEPFPDSLAIADRTRQAESEARPILITGATGALGQAFGRICRERSLAYLLLRRQEMDIADRESVELALGRLRPWAVINAAGFSRVDDAEREPRTCFRENAIGPSVLAAACARFSTALVTFSSDLVFDGQSSRPYVEADQVSPLGVYGRSQAEAERTVLDVCPAALIVRSSALFGPWDQHNFLTSELRQLLAGESRIAADDVTISPTYVPDLVHACVDLLIDGERGLWHLTSGRGLTWAGWLREAAGMLGVSKRLVERRPAAACGFIAPRPSYSVLASQKAWIMPALDDAMQRYCRDVQERWSRGTRLPGDLALVSPAAEPVEQF